MNPAILQEITDLLMQAQERPGNPFPGRRGAPDMPSPRDEKRLAREPTDDNLQHFMDVFGEEALGNAGRRKSGPSPGYTPQPRPRYPDVESDIMGGYTRKPVEDIMRQGADMDPGQMDRMRSETDSRGEGMTDEDMLALVNKGMFQGVPSHELTGDLEKDKATIDAVGNTMGNKQSLEQEGLYQELMDKFIKMHGEENLR